MPEESEKKNIVETLEESERAEISSLVRDGWRESSDRITSLIDDSRLAWDFYLQNQPSPTGGVSKDRTSATRNSQQKKGVRMGNLSKAIDVGIATLVASTFPSDEAFFDGTPQNDISLELKNQYMEFKRENIAEANIPQKMTDAWLRSFLDGTVAIFCPWRSLKRKRSFFVQESILGIPIPGRLKEVTKKVIDWEGTDCEVLSFNDWRVDPTAHKMEDSWFARRWYESTSSIKRKYPDAEDVVPYADSCAHSDNRNEERESFGLSFEPSISLESESQGNKRALLMVRYDDFEIGGKRYKNHMAVVLNDSQLVFFGKNEYADAHGGMPYIVAPYMSIPNQVYGKSGVKQSLPHAELIDTATRAVIDIAKMAASPQITFNVNDHALHSYLKANNNKLVSNSLIPMDSLSSINRLEFNASNITPVLGIIQQSDQQIQDLTGSTPLLAGDAPTQGRVSAFEIESRQSGANNRASLVKATFTTLMEKWIRMSFENDRVYKEKDEYVGRKPFTVDMIKQLDFKWTITSTRATIAKQRQMEAFKVIFTEILPGLNASGLLQDVGGGVQADVQKLFEHMVTLMGIKDITKIIPEESLQENRNQGSILPGQLGGQQLLPSAKGENTNGLSPSPPLPSTTGQFT